MTRNIYLAYFLAAIKSSWFWLGVWVLYYLKFTNYAGIGVVETVGITVGTLGEIPTGAIADLFGKKKTLILAFLFEACGSFLMAFSQSFSHLIIAVSIMWLGGALYSGTLDALIFDSLKQDKNEKNYDKIISNIASISLTIIAIVSVLGGFMYVYNPRLPFLMHAIFYSIGIIACFFLTEPLVDTVKFSFKNYLTQTKQGFAQLFVPISRQQTIKLLVIGFFFVILDEVVEPFLLVEFGFKAQGLGIIYSAIYLLSALSSQLTPWFRKRFDFSFGLIILGIITAVSLMISPIIGTIVGGLMVLLRYNLAQVFNNLTSIMINESTLSKYRATTISTFNMIKNMPYVLSAFFIGHLMDLISARTFAFYFGLALLLILLFQKFTLDKKLTTR